MVCASPLASKIAVVAVNSRPIVEIGNDQDVGFVISRACLYPSLYFARIIGSSHVGVPPRASDLEGWRNLCIKMMLNTPAIASAP